MKIILALTVAAILMNQVSSLATLGLVGVVAVALGLALSRWTRWLPDRLVHRDYPIE